MSDLDIWQGDFERYIRHYIAKHWSEGSDEEVAERYAAILVTLTAMQASILGTAADLSRESEDELVLSISSHARGKVLDLVVHGREDDNSSAAL